MSGLDEPADVTELATAIGEVGGTFAAEWERAQQLAGSLVPPTQLRALFVVERLGAVNLSGLAAELGASPPAVSKLCDRLEANRLLLRTPGPSRREISVELSHDGERLLADVREARQAALVEALEAMPAAARQALLEGLTQFHSASARQGDPAMPAAASEPA